MARAGGGTASADSVSEQLARDDGSLVVVGSDDHLLGGETEVSDRGSNFELNGAGIRRTGPSGIEKDGNFHRRRPDADRLRESFKKSRRAPSTTSSGTGRGRAGDGGGAEGSRQGHTVGDRTMLGGRGKGVRCDPIEGGRHHSGTRIRGGELVGNEVRPLQLRTDYGTVPGRQVEERASDGNDGTESGRFAAGHFLPKGSGCSETRREGPVGTLAEEGRTAHFTAGGSRPGIDTPALQTLVVGCLGEIPSGREDTCSEAVSRDILEAGNRVVMPFCPAFPAQPRALLEPQVKYKVPDPPPPPPRARSLGEESGAPDVMLTYSGVATVAVGGRHVSPPSDREAGDLAPISESRLDLDRLVELDSEGILTGILDVIRDETAFEALFLPEAMQALADRSASRGTSRHMMRHLEHLEKWGVVERTSQQKVVLPTFTVPKSSGGLRLVCDGRKLNRLMRPPPPMLLPGIRSVIARFLSVRYVAQDDGKSWFYQFPLGRGVDDYFGVNLGGARGPFVRAKLRALCMGWSWAPCIAHRSAMVLLPETDGVAWVDNFFVVGESEEETAQRYSEFKRRADYVGARLSDAEGFGEPKSNFVALGLEFDLSATPQRYRSAPDWVQKMLSSETLGRMMGGRPVTAREFYRVFGGLVWFWYTTGRRLCFLRSTLAFVRRAGREMAARPDGWDESLPLCPSVLRELAGVLDVLRRNDWVSAVPDNPEVTAWSDASDLEWAAVLEIVPEEVIQGCFPSPSRHHIFLKEMFAALQAVRLAAVLRPGHVLDLRVDNTAAVAAINKGHSSNFMGNEMLCALYETAGAADLRVRCTWVDTTSQRADEYTRGTKAPGGGISLPSLPQQCKFFE